MGKITCRNLLYLFTAFAFVCSIEFVPSANAASGPSPNGAASCLNLASQAGCEANQQASPEEQLAQKYAPTLMMTKQSGSCDKDGDVYFPTTVDFVFNNPDIQLRANGNGDPVIASPVTAQDLVTATAETYLDFPGDPRDPGCDYENYFLQMVTKFNLAPTTYAHIVYDPVERKLWLQYWFYYLFNDWNDTHESDWEMMMLSFNASSAEEALSQSPSEAAFAQHGGGEVANWTAEKVEKSGDRVVAYSSAGSHATYFDEATYIGWGENGTAFGCDKTLSPHNRYELNVVLVPDGIDPEGPLAWALYQGRWGQRESSVFNGPKGPNTGKKWNDPALAVENWRGSSLTVPGGDTISPSSTDIFCAFSETVSKAGIYLGSHLWATVFAILAVLAAFFLMMWKIWAYFMEALDIFGNEIRTFLGIGLIALPIGLLFNGFVILALQEPPLDWVVKWFNGGRDGRLAAAALVGGIQQITMMLVIAPTVIYAMKLIRDGEKPNVWLCYRGAIRNVPRLALTLIAIVVVLGFMTISIILIPVAVYLVIRWQFFAQATILDNKRGVRESLQASTAATDRRWWSALFYALAFQILAALPGPVIGIFILVVGGAKVEFANFVSSFLYAIFVPLAIIGLTMAYHRLKGDPIVEPEMRTHRKPAVDPQIQPGHAGAAD